MQSSVNISEEFVEALNEVLEDEFEDIYEAREMQRRKSTHGSFSTGMKVKFACEDCDKRWTSAQGTVIVRFSYSRSDGVIRARAHVYKQLCKGCDGLGEISTYEDEVLSIANEFLEFLDETVVNP